MFINVFMSVYKLLFHLFFFIFKSIGIYDIGKYHEVLQDLYKRYGPLVRQDLGKNVIIHVFDPDDIKTVYINEGKHPNIAPLQESALLYRQSRGFSLGLGNM